MHLLSFGPEDLSRFRFALGMAQMFGVFTSVILLVETGVNDLSLGSVIGTGLLTTLSRLLFKGRSATSGESR